MGWSFWSFSQSNPSSTQAPDRSQRQVCWDTRDAYFACLDSKSVLKPGQEQNGACAMEKKAYEGSCAQSWIEYFNKRRVLQEQQKDQLAMAAAQAEEAARKR